MSDFDASYARLQARCEQVAAKRIATWERIQKEAPEIAEFLLDVNREFGKPVKTWVVIGKERVL